MAERAALVLAAGLLCDADVWRPVADLLEDVAETDIVDFIGCRSIGEMADKLLHTTNGRFALAGHSMGARVALEAFTRAPDRVDRLALLNTGIHPLRTGEPEARELLVDRGHEQGMTAVAAEWLPPMMGKLGHENPALMQALTTMVERSTPDSFAGQIRALVERPDAEAALGRVTVPTLLLSATEDRWSPPEQHEAMLTLAPHAKLVIVQNAGHMAPVEQPESVAAALREWLAA